MADLVRMELVEVVAETMHDLTPEERLMVIGEFCRACGDANPGCQCWNDD